MCIKELQKTGKLVEALEDREAVEKTLDKIKNIKKKILEFKEKALSGNYEYTKSEEKEEKVLDDVAIVAVKAEYRKTALKIGKNVLNASLG